MSEEKEPKFFKYPYIPYTPEEAIYFWQLKATPKYFYLIADRYKSLLHLCIRDVIQEYGLENDPRVIKADQEILRLATKRFVESPYIIWLKEKQPLEKWWYYLEEIHHGVYPLERLPDHLKDIYREHLKECHINDWQNLTNPDKFKYYICNPFNPWDASAALYNRELIHKFGWEDDPRVIEADKKILKLSFEYSPVYLTEDEIYYKPEPNWWWYFLYDIHNGDYPLDLLPDHLKDIYREHLKKLGKIT